MSELKTKKNRESVAGFLKTVENEQRRKDCKAVIDIMKEITGEKPVMWGGSIIGFGSYHYKYASGQEGDWPLTGVSPRKQALSVYIMSGFEEENPLMDKLGKYKTGKSCLYVKNLEDIHIPTLKKLIGKSVTRMKKTYK